MPRITISLPDALKESLDSFAQANDLPVSVVVQQGLSLLLNGELPKQPGPAPTPHDEDGNPLAHRVENLEEVCRAFAQHQELVRAALERLARNSSTSIYIPPAFPDIPW
jgi:hypothetical protein